MQKTIEISLLYCWFPGAFTLNVKLREMMISERNGSFLGDARDRAERTKL